MRANAPLGCFLVLAVATCGGERDVAAGHPILTEGTDVSAAETRYDPTVFDSVTWGSPEEALARGQELWGYACAQCHGAHGEGDGGFVQDGDTLRPPSFRVEGWRYAQDREGLLHQIYVGTDRGMPHWGLRRMQPRDMDAVATYIVEELTGPRAGP